jgi:hypothetical protein
MVSGFVRCLSALALSVTLPALAQTAAQNGSDLSVKLPKRKVPANVILVKGAWFSANDPAAAVPEGGSITHNVFRNRYFGITYPLPLDWIEQYTAPPPSDSGRYVLAQIWRPNSYKGDARGNIQITAQDMFFTPLPAANALQLIEYAKSHFRPTTSWSQNARKPRFPDTTLPVLRTGPPWRNCTGMCWPPKFAVMRWNLFS